MKGTWLRIIMLLIFVGGVAMTGGWLVLRGDTPELPKIAADEPPAIEESRPQDIPVPDTNSITLSSIIEPFEAIPISARITANISGLSVRDGSTVRKGQLLCILDDTEIRRDIDSARLSLLRAENALDSARRTRDSSSKTASLALTQARQNLSAAQTKNSLEMQEAQDLLSRAKRELSDYEILLKAKAVSADDVIKKREAVEDAKRTLDLLSASQSADIEAKLKAVEKAELDVENECVSGKDIEACQKAVSNAQEELADRRNLLADTRITAPIGGAVRIIPRTKTSSSTATGQSAEKLGPGVRIYEGDPFLEIVTEQACCRVEVDETDVARLRVGTPASISGDGFGRQKLSGKVAEILASGRKAAEGISLFPVTILITSPMHGARMGMTADVTVDLEQRSAKGDEDHE
jgi:multidrug efflux pump subunit AcrA (membrane-fusion protein)